MQVIQVAESLFGWVWDLFQIEYPGTGLTIAVISLGGLVVVLSFRVLALMLGISITPGSAAKSLSGNGGNNKKIKVPEKRKGDTK